MGAEMVLAMDPAMPPSMKSLKTCWTLLGAFVVEDPVIQDIININHFLYLTDLNSAQWVCIKSVFINAHIVLDFISANGALF